MTPLPEKKILAAFIIAVEAGKYKLPRKGGRRHGGTCAAGGKRGGGMPSPCKEKCDILKKRVTFFKSKGRSNDTEGGAGLRIMGIDPGYAIVGVGVLDYEGNRFKTVEYGACLLYTSRCV